MVTHPHSDGRKLVLASTKYQGMWKTQDGKLHSNILHQFEKEFLFVTDNYDVSTPVPNNLDSWSLHVTTVRINEGLNKRASIILNKN